MMRAILSIAACSGILALSACATRPPAAERVPSPAPKPTAIAKNNRFDMRQNGRQMSADDFDAWMKARGIRVAKGKPQPELEAKRKPMRQPKPKP